MDNEVKARQDKAQRAMALIDEAIHSGTLVSVEATDRATQKPVTVLAEMYEDKAQGKVALRPIARLFMESDPNAEIIPPDGTINTFAKSGPEALAQAAAAPV